jgi:hypothetical protein
MAECSQQPKRESKTMEERRRTAKDVTRSEVHAVAYEAGVVDEVAESEVS